MWLGDIFFLLYNIPNICILSCYWNDPRLVNVWLLSLWDVYNSSNCVPCVACYSFVSSDCFNLLSLAWTKIPGWNNSVSFFSMAVISEYLQTNISDVLKTYSLLKTIMSRWDFIISSYKRFIISLGEYLSAVLVNIPYIYVNEGISVILQNVDGTK